MIMEKYFFGAFSHRFFPGKWNQEIESNVDALEKVIVSEISNESLRVGEVKYNEAFGVDGTFKSLALD
jgi:hypothetical protein